MNKLISAEWYRARKSSKMFIITLICMIFFTYLGLLESELLEQDIKVTDGFYSLIGLPSGMMVYISCFVAGMFVVSYENKLLHFDMMAGNKISHIIISKVIITAPVLTLFYSLCTTVAALIVANKNGIGDTDIFISYILAYTCINFRIIVVSILIMTIFKGVLGLVVVFVRFAVLDILPMMILTELSEDNEKFAKLANIFTTSQYNLLNGESISASNTALIVGMTVFEIVFVYVLSYISHKKKMFY